MSTREKLKPYKVITNGDMSGNITSIPTIIQGISLLSYDVSWAGTSPVGTLSVQGSNTYALDATGAVQTAGNWTSLLLNVNGTAQTTVAVSGNTGTALIDVNLTGIYAIRLIYTFGSGVGAMQATVAGKVS